MPLWGSSCAKSNEYPARRGLKLESRWKRSLPYLLAVLAKDHVYLIVIYHLVCLSAGALRIKNGSVGLDVTNIEKLGIFETVFPAHTDIRRHIVSISKFLRKINVTFIGEAGIVAYKNAILHYNHSASSIAGYKRFRIERGLRNTLVTA